MRKTLAALAITGLLGVAPLAVSAAPATAVSPRVPYTGLVQQADWGCGPRCEYWRHPRWEHERWEHRRWEHNRPNYGWNYAPYRQSYGYYGYYR